jgi:hypothetical protein
MTNPTAGKAAPFGDRFGSNAQPAEIGFAHAEEKSNPRPSGTAPFSKGCTTE